MIRIKGLSALACLIGLSHYCYSQKVDYKKIRRDKYLATCRSDSQSTFKAHTMLMTIDINKLNNNLDIYYHDQGLIYYSMSLHSRNKKYMDTAVMMYKKALKINPMNKDVLWDGAIALVFSNHCNEGLKYLDTYLKIVPTTEADTTSINGMRSICAERAEQH